MAQPKRTPPPPDAEAGTWEGRSVARRFISPDGMTVLVGKSASDNDILSIKLGKPRDFWLHVASESGSHVVVRNPQNLDRMPRDTQQFAAAAAARYSKARAGGQVAVHITICAEVSKRRGQPPGQVSLGRYKTIKARPLEDEPEAQPVESFGFLNYNRQPGAMMPKTIQMTATIRRSFTTLLVASMLACGGAEQSKPAAKPSGAANSQPLRLGFVVNSPSDFRVLARAGIRKAEAEFGVEVDFQVPGQATAAQQRQIIETLIAKGVSGMAVSVLDPKGAVGILNDAAKRMPVVTQDSDCPESNRLAYIGTDNIEAGRVAGREIAKALPDGGQVALFVGRLDVQNARERRQGIIEALEGTGIEVVETFTDETQRITAQNNVRNALDKYPDLGCLTGLWSYNTPAIVKVVEEKGLAGKIQIVGFDEEKATLDGIADGVVRSTVVQQPFEFGYQSIKTLTLLARDQDPGLPDDGLAYVPVQVIDQAGLAAFREQLATQLAAGGS